MDLFNTIFGNIEDDNKPVTYNFVYADVCINGKIVIEPSWYLKISKDNYSGLIEVTNKIKEKISKQWIIEVNELSKKHRPIMECLNPYNKIEQTEATFFHPL